MFSRHTLLTSSSLRERLYYVFDGYEESSLNIHNAERQRCYRKQSPSSIFDGNTPLTTKQNPFLGNERNVSSGVFTSGKNGRKLDDHPASSRRRRQFNRQYCYFIYHNPSVIIVGEDVDVMVLMVALTPKDKNIYLLKPGKGKNNNVIYSSATEQKRYSSIKNHLLFLHAASGCDTTSSFMNKGNKTFFKLLKNNPSV
ncbi:hypothetical protein ILUMI_04069 [Ignelater luminosus]|uniref:Uncharacterized protein n=1 Tax=Ignelater luminosus TaxID=2038154 RepID=A0A8K0D9M8_IGNLU|nr:hypothetical protein ILUMI_04069 [Ignelater luminosus]